MKQQRMNLLLRILFIILIIAISGAAVLQIFAPEYMGSHAAYGISTGWQREIGIWNLAVLIIILAVNIKYDWFYLRIALLALIIGGIGIGTNHLLNFIKYHSPVNAIGAIENYLLVFGWIIGWFIENKTIKLQNSL